MTLKYSLSGIPSTIDDFIDKCKKKDVIEVEICLNTPDEMLKDSYGKYYISYEAKTESGKKFSLPIFNEPSYFNGSLGDDPIVGEGLKKDIKKLVRGLKKRKVNIKLGCKLITGLGRTTYLTQNKMKKMEWR